MKVFIKNPSHDTMLTYGTLSTAWGRLNSVRIEVQQKGTEAFISIVGRLERNSAKQYSRLNVRFLKKNQIL